MIDRHAIVTYTLSLIGTPYAHYQRCAGAGLDCIQTVILVAEHMGVVIPSTEVPYYSPQWHVHQRTELLLNTVRSYGCKECSADKALPGDFILFRFEKTQPCSHAAILVYDNQIVHALRSQKAVIKQPFRGAWRSKWAVHYFSLPGVA